MSEKRLWLISSLFSAGLLAILVILWLEMDDHDRATSQLVNMEETNQFLQQNWESTLDPDFPGYSPTLKVPTGVFIHSISFFNSTEVHLSGYIWQKYQLGLHDSILPEPGEIGFVLPEQINTGSDIEPREMYRIRQNNEEVIGWYFEATLKQEFDYSTYPFDDKTVWVKLWAKDFPANVVLVPDFESYRATGIEDTFGIDPDIVMGAWIREDTYFDYALSSYDTDFGIDNYVGQTGFPELHYNFVIKRNFGDAFIIYVLPLFLVASLLFASLLTVSADDELASKHDFSTNGFIAASSALFFVVLIGHISLREQFAGSGVVYIEYFYILMYVFLVASTLNTYVFSIQAARWLTIIHYRDNLIPKLAYWPVLLTLLILVTLAVRA